MRHNKVDLSPPRRPHARWVSWGLWAVFSVSALFLATFVLLDAFTASDTRKYSGYLDSKTQSEIIHFPINIPISKILVKNGEQVQKDQILAHYDKEEILHKINSLELKIFHIQIFRDCLELPPLKPRPNTSSSEKFIIENTVLERAFSEKKCMEIHLQNIQKKSSILTKREFFLTHSNRLVRELTGNRTAVQMTQLNIPRSALNLQIRNTLGIINLELSNEISRQQVFISETIASSNTKIRELENQLRELQQLLESPWITSPTSGYIHGVAEKSKLNAVRSSAKFGIVEPIYVDNLNFIVELTPEDLEEIQVGNNIEISQRYIEYGGHILSAKINQISPIWSAFNEGEVKARIGISIKDTQKNTKNVDEFFHSLSQGVETQVSVVMGKSTVKNSLQRSFDKIIIDPWIKL